MATLINLKPVQDALILNLQEQRPAIGSGQEFLTLLVGLENAGGTLNNKGGLNVANTIALLQRVADPKVREDLIKQLDGNGSTRVTISVAGQSETIVKSPCFAGDFHAFVTHTGLFASFQMAYYQSQLVTEPVPSAPKPVQAAGLASGLATAASGVQTAANPLPASGFAGVVPKPNATIGPRSGTAAAIIAQPQVPSGNATVVKK